MGRVGFEISDDERLVVMRAIEVARVLNYDQMPKRYHGCAMALIAQEWLDTIDDDVIDEALSYGELFEERYGGRDLGERQTYYYKHVLREELFKRLNGIDDGTDECHHTEEEHDRNVSFRQAIRVACNDAIEAGADIKAFFADDADGAGRLAICAFGRIFIEIRCGENTGWVLFSGRPEDINKLQFDKALVDHKIDSESMVITELAIGVKDPEQQLNISHGAKSFVTESE